MCWQLVTAHMFRTFGIWGGHHEHPLAKELPNNFADFVWILPISFPSLHTFVCRYFCK
jgi:hypothetical protein